MQYRVVQHGPGDSQKEKEKADARLAVERQLYAVFRKYESAKI